MINLLMVYAMEVIGEDPTAKGGPRVANELLVGLVWLVSEMHIRCKLRVIPVPINLGNSKIPKPGLRINDGDDNFLASFDKRSIF